MTQATTHKPTKEITLLALGDRYGLYGDACGNVGRVCEKCIRAVKTLEPKRVYLEESGISGFLVAGIKVEVSGDIPEDKLIAFGDVFDKATGLALRAAFDKASKIWYVRELRNTDGTPSGRFFETRKKEPLAW